MIGVSWSFEKSKPAPQRSALEPFPLHIMLHTIETRLPDSEFNRGRQLRVSLGPWRAKGLLSVWAAPLWKKPANVLGLQTRLHVPQHECPIQASEAREASALLSTPGKAPCAVLSL